MRPLPRAASFLAVVLLGAGPLHAQHTPEAAPPSLKNVVTVSPAGGHFTTVAAALASITNASSSNRYLIKIGPGTYVGRAVMKPYVDLEGSGTLTTILTAPAAGTVGAAAVVRAANNSEIRFLTVRGGTGGILSVGVYGEGLIQLTHVFVTAGGGTQGNFGVYGQGAVVAVRDSEISITASSLATAIFSVGGVADIGQSTLYAAGPVGGGLVKEGLSAAFVADSSVTGPVGIEGRPNAQVTLNSVRVVGVSASVGILCNGCIATVRTSSVTAASNGAAPRHGIRLTGAGATVSVQGGSVSGSEGTLSAAAGTIARVAGAFLSGGPAGGGGGLTCAGVTDENYVFFANSCP